ncbi:MAG: gliding motility-associated C-terminal domain-containing protein [Bacteroidia bacterium]
MKIFIPPLKIFASLLLLIFNLQVSAKFENGHYNHKNSNVYALYNGKCLNNSLIVPDKSITLLLPPVANLDTISVPANSTTYINVLTNDFDPAGNPFYLDSITEGPLLGSAIIIGNQIAYTPAVTQCGLIDTLTYQIRNSNNETDTAKVILYIIGISTPIITANTPICIGGILQLTSNPYNEGDYLWAGPAGFTSGVENPVLGNVGLINSGTYTLVVNGGGCTSDTAYINVVVIPLPTVSLPADTTLCAGDSLLLDGGAGFNYTWSNGVTTQTQIIDSSGTYIVTVSNLCGTATDNMQVTFIAPPAPNLGNDSAICIGSSYTLHANTNAQSYLWSNGSTLSTLTVNTSGTYWVIATNQCGSGTDTVVIIVSNPLPPITIGNDTLLCNGDSVLLDAGSGVGLTYLWSNGFTTQTVFVSAPGTYIITVTNACGSKKDTIDLSTAVTPVINLGVDTSLCFGVPTIISGPGNATTYQWSTGGTNQQLSIDSLGTYWLIAINQCGSDTDSVSFNSFDLPPVVNLGNDTLLCNGILISLDAGSGYAYNWSNGSTTQVISVDTQGTYWVTVSNTCGNANDTINITTETTPLVNLGTDTTLCAGGSTTLTAPANATFYLWSDGSTLQNYTADTLGTVWLIAGNVCGSDTDSVSFNSFVLLPAVTLTNDTLLCNGSGILLDAGAGFIYSWSDGSTTQTINVNTQGTFTVTVTNVCGSASDSININTEVTPVVDLGGDTLICTGGSVTLTAPSNATTYLWSDGSTSQNLIVDTLGTYWLIATNICGSDTDSVTFYAFALPPVVNLGNDTLLCNGLSINLDAGPGYLYLWNDGSTTQVISAAAQGVYSVTITNVCGSVSDSIFISNENTPQVNLGNDTYLCENATIILTGPSNATSYLWNDGSTLQTLSVDSIGYYWLIANNICGSDTDSIYITPLINLPTVNLGNDLIVCNGGTVQLLADSGYTYLWSTGSTDQSIIVAASGTYIVTVDNGCGTAKDTVEITVGITPVVNLGNDTSLCAGNSITFYPPVNATLYLWNNDSTYPSFTTDTAGTFWLIATNLCGSDTDSITVNAIIPLATVDLGNDTTFCVGDSITLNAGAGFIYQWSNGSSDQSIIVNTTGTYTVTVSNVCATATDVIQIGSETIPSVSLPNDTSLCSGTSLTINVSGNATTFLWNDGSTLDHISVDTTGIYWVTASNKCGSASDTMIINNIYQLPKVDLGTDTSLCFEQSIHLSPGVFANYLWQDNSTNPFYHVTQQGTYWVQVTDNNGCKASDTLIVDTVYALPSAFLPPDTLICTGDTLTINSLNNYSSYLWNDGSGSSQITVNDTGYYWLAVVDQNGCSGIDTILVGSNCDSVDLDSVIFFPNVFTPNDDDQNNTWHATGQVDFFEIEIFDRWGVKMFDANSILKEWDGRYQSNDCPAGVYYYIAKYRIKANDEMKIKTGFITLLR